MLCIWWSVHRVQCWKLLAEKPTVTADVYFERLRNLKANLKNVRPQQHKVYFYHDSVRPPIARTTNAELMKTPSSTKPGYASLYDTFSTDFFLYLHPPIYCEAVFLCFLERPTATAKGLQNLDIIRACDNSLRFLPLEQIVYHFEGGHSS
ncbi:hypothetical protein Y032_0823g2540 [Ancylostoma ceylanicum]|uniref:Uncharacterized protein n=1 Tax=Ancylostoma ceylanicum TaxID=53326 RepID=A0A016WBD2_9BILA|nr:hypothetical protein Y032_0823g2540 [Ancylostoma ceylanicum]